jgi:SpoVK/Ycf46/Vps4 family AAA+-type ATPase
MSHELTEVSSAVLEENHSTGLLKGRMWSQHDNSYVPCEKAVDELPNGQYVIVATDRGIHFTKHDVNTDTLIDLPDSAGEEIVDGIEEFWTKENHFRKLGFLWKRGVLLYGPPGSGKTSTLQQISNSIIAQGGCSFYVDNPAVGAKGLRLFRHIEKTRPILVMLEDIDAIISKYGESDLLALLDGELQIDNVVFIATTNYPETLDKRITNRPSRFDIVKRIGMPNDEARKTYLLAINERLKDDPELLKEWVKLTNGYSVAHLKETVVSVEVFEKTLVETVARLNTMIDTTASSSDKDEVTRSNFGFQ